MRRLLRALWRTFRGERPMPPMPPIVQSRAVWQALARVQVEHEVELARLQAWSERLLDAEREGLN